ncbi:unnamed protein product, partial [Iphiclides podalirius]
MEITKKNFAEEFENITNNLKRSCFVGFDAEFTAILTKECFKHRLFDTNEERYDKIKTEVSKMIMTQVGLNMFQYDRESDSYVSVGYTFHLCPQVVGDIDQSFIFQASTLKFLCKHNFNFNKFTYEGISYFSKEEQKKIYLEMKNKSLASYLAQGLEIEEERQIQHYCSEVCKWLHNSEEETMYIDMHNPVLRYLIHVEIQKRFPTVLTTVSLGNSNKILIYRDKHVEGANSTPIDKLEENFIKSVFGFSQVIQLLEHYRKPLVGHNVFLDLILLHNQFIGPLPIAYSSFKKNINSMFPIIFDTKYISNEMSKKLTLDEVWKSNVLQDLYEFFVNGRCKKLQYGLNEIKLSTPFNVNQSYHEAGWDSYCTGYCFIRLGHWAACENSGRHRPVGPTEMLAALANFSNKVNVIRGATPYMNLLGTDPPTHRPKLLHIKSLRERIISIEKCTQNVGGKRSPGNLGRNILANNYHNVYTKPGRIKTLHKELGTVLFRCYVYTHRTVRVVPHGDAKFSGRASGDGYGSNCQPAPFPCRGAFQLTRTVPRCAPLRPCRPRSVRDAATPCPTCAHVAHPARRLATGQSTRARAAHPHTRPLALIPRRRLDRIDCARVSRAESYIFAAGAFLKRARGPLDSRDAVAGALAGAGAADVRPCGSRAVLVAAGAHFTADKILNQFRNSPDYRVSTYNPYKHSAAGRIAIWSGALITGSLLLLLFHKKVKSSVYP